MTEIGDARIGFYLENRVVIDEWARLRQEAGDAVYAVFQQLHEKLDGVASGLPGRPLLAPFLDGPWPAYALVDRRWPSAEPDHRVPVGVTLEMDRKGLFLGPTVPNVFVGIRLEKSLAQYSDLHAALLRSAEGQSVYDNRPTPWWPCWRNVPQATVRWWEDRQAFEQTLVDALARAWHDLAPVVEQELRLGGSLTG